MSIPNTNYDAHTTGYETINGIHLYYELHGDRGDWLVLIHGGGSTIGTSFGRILPILAASFRIVALELQAHGHTSDREAPESFEQDASDVAALLERLTIPKASVFGFSNGGNTAMQLAASRPQLVHKLILASSFYKRSGLAPGLLEGMTDATLEDMPAALREAFLEINPDPERLQNMFNKDKARMLQFSDWKDDLLRSIEAPTLLISGDQDVILPVHVLEMAQLIPSARVCILPATHGSYMEVAESGSNNRKLTELTAELIRSFLIEP